MGEKLIKSAEEGIESIAHLLRSSARDAQHRRIGIEIERIGIWPDCTPFGYEKTRSAEGEIRPGAEALLKELNQAYGWPLSPNSEKPLGLTPDTGSITLEPGSQLELATEASVELESLVQKTRQFEKAVDKITLPWGLTWVGLGTNPCNGADDIDVIPSKRYDIMTTYLGNKAPLATSMMRISSSVQINLDYRSEEEGITMLRVALAASPISYALFANSPLHKGKETGYLAYRREIWKHTDPDRTGVLPEAFNENFSFADYAQYLWHYPLMFAQDKDGQFVPANGKSLDKIFSGELTNVEASEANQQSAVRQLFTEARIKPGYVEVRSVDGHRPRERYAAAAFWMGILYDDDARELVLKTLGSVTPELREELLEETSKKGLAAKAGGINIRAICEELVDASRQGLTRRGYGEEKYLVPIEENLRDGVTPAERILEIFRKTESKKIRAVLNYASCTDLD